MTNEQQTWILKPGVTFTQAKESDWLHMYPHQLASMRADIPRSIFEQCFVELDVSGLTNQVEGELRKLNYRVEFTDDKIRFQDIAKQIVLLLLNQEGETKK